MPLRIEAGSIDIFASNTIDLIIDINGYFAPMTTGGLSLYSVSPCRRAGLAQSGRNAGLQREEGRAGDRRILRDRSTRSHAC